MSLSSITAPTLPPNVTSTGSSTTTLPSTISNFENGVAGPAASQVATTPFDPYQGQMVAGPNSNMTQAYGMAPGAVGAYQPYMGAATGALNTVLPQTQQQMGIANTAGGLGVAAAYDPANSWASQSSSWMNPYNSQVVQQIANAGNQNFQTQMMPAINSQFIGSGDFNSLSNMGGLSMGAGLAQQGITSAQSSALQSGYGQSMQGYLTQLANQEQAASNAGNLANQTGYMGNYGATGAASGYGGLGTQASQLGWGDVNNLYQSGAPFQQLGQQAINAQINENFNPSRTWQNQQLGAATGAMSQLPWPGSVSGTSNAPLAGAGYGPSTVGQLATVAGGLGAAQSLFPQTSSAIGGGLSSLYNSLFGGSNSPVGGTGTTANGIDSTMNTFGSTGGTSYGTATDPYGSLLGGLGAGAGSSTDFASMLTTSP